MNEIAELQQQVEGLRGTLKGLLGELDTLKAQARSRREVGATVAQQVTTWRAQASAAVAVDLQRLAAGQAVPMLELRAANGVINLGPWMVAAMGEKACSAWLASMVDELPEGLDAPHRAARMHDIGREIDMVAAAEEALMREADDLGHPLDPRADADPRAALILGFGE
jgi:hypothetical protein